MWWPDIVTLVNGLHLYNAFLPYWYLKHLRFPFHPQQTWQSCHARCLPAKSSRGLNHQPCMENPLYHLSHNSIGSVVSSVLLTEETTILSFIYHDETDKDTMSCQLVHEAPVHLKELTAMLNYIILQSFVCTEPSFSEFSPWGQEWQKMRDRTCSEEWTQFHHSYTVYTSLLENTALLLSYFLNVTSSVPIIQPQTGRVLSSQAGWLASDKHIRHPADFGTKST